MKVRAQSGDWVKVVATRPGFGILLEVTSDVVELAPKQARQLAIYLQSVASSQEAKI